MTLMQLSTHDYLSESHKWNALHYCKELMMSLFCLCSDCSDCYRYIIYLKDKFNLLFLRFIFCCGGDYILNGFHCNIIRGKIKYYHFVQYFAMSLSSFASWYWIVRTIKMWCFIKKKGKMFFLALQLVCLIWIDRIGAERKYKG